MIVFPNCKINLGLRILNKRADGFHDLETLFIPIPLKDGLEIIQQDRQLEEDCSFTLSGLDLKISPEDNICLKAYHLLKQDFPGLPPVRMHLHKCIPHGAGLGGGSSDAAHTILLLNKKFNLGLDHAQLQQYAVRLGSDCPFFIINSPCLGTGRGERLEPVNLPVHGLRLVLINPGILINTGWAFSRIQPKAVSLPWDRVCSSPPQEWKDLLENDFEPVVFSEYPEIGQIKYELYQKGAVYAGMSGSGSSVFGLFPAESLLSLSFPPSYFSRQFIL